MVYNKSQSLFTAQFDANSLLQISSKLQQLAETAL